MANSYKSPKMAETNKYQERENTLNLLKKPPVPRPSSHYNNFTGQQQDKKPYSFLNGGKASKEKKEANLPDHLKTMKNGVPNQNKSQSGGFKRAKVAPQLMPRQMMAKQAELLTDDGDLFESGPPLMEFTN